MDGESLQLPTTTCWVFALPSRRPSSSISVRLEFTSFSLQILSTYDDDGDDAPRPNLCSLFHLTASS